MSWVRWAALVTIVNEPRDLIKKVGGEDAVQPETARRCRSGGNAKPSVSSVAS
jgi:hypothetical protein